MLKKLGVTEASRNGDRAVVVAAWPPSELRALVGSLPFDPLHEIALAMKTCLELDDDAMEQLTDLDDEAQAAVEQLAYSAAIRRWYVTRLTSMVKLDS